MRVASGKFLHPEMIESLDVQEAATEDGIEKVVLHLTMFSGAKHTVKCRREDAASLIEKYTDDLELRP